VRCHKCETERELCPGLAELRWLALLERIPARHRHGVTLAPRRKRDVSNSGLTLQAKHELRLVQQVMWCTPRAWP